MKKFNFLSLLLTAGLALGLTACSNKDDEVIVQNNDEGGIYARVSIAVPNGGGTTRAASADDSEDYDVGTLDEYTVHSATLYVFNEDGEKVAKVPLTQFTKVADTPNASPNTETEGYAIWNSTVERMYKSEANEPKPTQAFKFRVYAVVNKEFATEPNTEDDFKTLLLSSQAPGNTVPEGGIPMTSRTTDTGLLYTEVEVNPSTDYNRSNPLSFSMVVEREWAKITIKTNKTTDNDNEYAIYEDPGKETTPKIATIKLEKVYPINLMNTSYAYRHVANLAYNNGIPSIIEGTESYGKIKVDYAQESENRYVIDPLTTSKKLVDGNELVVLNPALTNGSFVTMPTTEATSAVVTYALENTQYVSLQRQGYSTGVAFIGNMTPYEGGEANKVRGETKDQTVAYSSGQPLYLIGYHFYTSLAAVKAWNPSLKEKTEEELVADYNLVVYPNNYCLYKFFPRHWDNGNNSVMGPMEFAIVRNNLYSLKVQDILIPGKPVTNPDVPGPDGPKPDPTPDEYWEIYMKVTMNVKPWIVRNNESIILQ
jgi:hypothetical protein